MLRLVLGNTLVRPNPDRTPGTTMFLSTVCKPKRNHRETAPPARALPPNHFWRQTQHAGHLAIVKVAAQLVEQVGRRSKTKPVWNVRAGHHSQSGRRMRISSTWDTSPSSRRISELRLTARWGFDRFGWQF